jgi:hypothetical protein
MLSARVGGMPTTGEATAGPLGGVSTVPTVLMYSVDTCMASAFHSTMYDPYGSYVLLVHHLVASILLKLLIAISL